MMVLLNTFSRKRPNTRFQMIHGAYPVIARANFGSELLIFYRI